MFELLKNLLLVGQSDDAAIDVADNARLAEAALMFHVIAVDGVIDPRENDAALAVLCERFDLSPDDAHTLLDEARVADHGAVDLYGFTSTLKRNLDREQRIAFIEQLWRVVLADEELHELEDNIVWRVAELLHVEARDRISARQRVVEQSRTA